MVAVKAKKEETKTQLRKFQYVLLAVALALAVLFLPLGLDQTGQRTLSVTLFMLVLFMTEAVPLAVTAFSGCFLFWAWAGLPVSKAFAGFGNSTPWFILGVLLIGVMATKTGLSKRLAFLIMKRLGTNYAIILFGLILIDFILTFFIPSGPARVVILCTVAMGLISSWGLDKKSNIAKGLILVLAYSATIFDKVVIAGAASILARGIIESHGNITIYWNTWLIAYLPLTIITVFFLWFLTLKLFPPERKVLEVDGKTVFDEELEKMGPITISEKKTLILVILATALWLTDSFHGIEATVIGIGVGLLGCMPLIGVLDKKDLEKVNYPIIIFVGGALSMGLVLADTNVLPVITTYLFNWMEPFSNNDSLITLALYGYANVFHLFLGNEPAMLSASLPSVMTFVLDHGYNPLATGMIWTFAAGGKLFIYQSSVLALGYSFGTFEPIDLFKLGLALIIVEAFLIFLLVPLYWPLLGIALH